MKFLNFTLLLLSFLILNTVISTQVFAGCRCVPVPFKYRWEKAGTIFIGKVVEIKPLYKYTWSAYDDKPVQVTFHVVEHLKGEEAPLEEETSSKKELKEKVKEQGKKVVKKAKKIVTGEAEESFVLHTSLQNLTCMGYPFEEGKQYLVYAYERRADASEPWSLYNFPSGTYGVGGLCGGTMPYRKAKEELKKIRIQIDEDMRVLIKNMEKK